MTEKELKSFAINYMGKKEMESRDYIIYKFNELRVKNNLSEKEVDEFLKINRSYFENRGYKVYFTNAKFVYNNASMTVQPNELMIAIKDTNIYD